MLHSLRKLKGRAALAFVLVLATQFAYAGQLCHSIAKAAAGPSRSGGSIAAPCAALSAQPCCDAGALHKVTCFSLHKVTCFSYAADLRTSVSAAAPAAASVLPACAWRVVAPLAASSSDVPLRVASAGPSPPSYILYRRFLS